MRHPCWHWKRNGDAWNGFCHIYFDATLPWDAIEDISEEDEDFFEEQLWAIREGLA